MIRATEVAFSAYPVTDVARAREFYEGVLGLEPTVLAGGQWVEYYLGPNTLSIGSAPGWNPSSEGACVALEVEDFDAAITALKEKNVRFKMEPFPTPVCRMAFIFDPDSNVICIHKRNS